MSKSKYENSDLYLVVLPTINLSSEYGKTDQILTVFPDQYFATRFFPEEVDSYISVFTNRTNYLTGGHVTGYQLIKESTPEGRVIVRVIQNVE